MYDYIPPPWKKPLPGNLLWNWWIPECEGPFSILDFEIIEECLVGKLSGKFANTITSKELERILNGIP